MSRFTMKTTLLLLTLLAVLNSASSYASICAEYIPLEAEIDNTNYIFIAQIVSVRMVKSKGEMPQTFESEFEVLKNIKGSKLKNIRTLTNSGTWPMFTPGNRYIVFTDDGHVSRCINSIVVLSPGYPELFEHEEEYIKSVEDYIRFGKSINVEQLYNLHRNHIELSPCN